MTTLRTLLIASAIAVSAVSAAQADDAAAGSYKLAFGPPVTCPVTLYSAIEPAKRGVTFNLINPGTGNRISMKTHDPQSGGEVDAFPIVTSGRDLTDFMNGSVGLSAIQVSGLIRQILTGRRSVTCALSATSSRSSASAAPTSWPR